MNLKTVAVTAIVSHMRNMRNEKVVSYKEHRNDLTDDSISRDACDIPIFYTISYVFLFTNHEVGDISKKKVAVVFEITTILS